MDSDPPAEGDDDEFALIARFFAPLAAAEPGAFGLGDDAAALAPPAGCDVVMTCDTIVEGVHFLSVDPPDSVGVKALGVNLSDLAAMGATPAAYLLSVALPSLWNGTQRHDWLAGFTAGLAALQREHGLVLAGGDTVATGDKLCLTVTALGWVEAGRALRRCGGQPGDEIFVSGSIGDAGLGLRALTGGLAGTPSPLQAALIDRYRRPRPRTRLGCRLLGLAHAAIDVSDGLLADLAHLCRQSELNADVWLAQMPISAAAQAVVGEDEADRLALISMGDDYELLFAVPPERCAAVARLAAELALPLSRIGVLTRPAGGRTGAVRVLSGVGMPIDVDRAGYRHF